MVPVSVIVPAHDEEHVIGRSLRSMLDGAEEGELELVVVCNGCHDATAAAAAAAAPDAVVVELPVASKVAALNEGERHATRFPRFYVDADLVVGIDAIRATAEALASSDVHCASPFARYDVSGRPWLVRRYFEVWQQLPYFNDERTGGVFALSEEGRARFGPFPDLTNDDQFVLQHFGRSERRCLREHAFDVQAPRTVADLLRIRTRVYRGNRQLGSHPTPSEATGGAGRGLLRLGRRPAQIPGVAAYASLSAVAKWRARRPAAGWERDDSTRAAGVARAGSERMGAPAGSVDEPIGYVIGSYPAPSHTFVLREVQELRGLGLTVRTFSIHRTPGALLLSEADRTEAAITESLLPVRAMHLLRVHASLWRRHPWAWCATAVEALRVAPPGARARLWQLFYLTEAVLLAERCREAGVRRLHAHLANVAADVAWLATRLGRRCDPAGEWRWSFTMHGPTEFSEVERFNLARKVGAADAVVCISEFCRSQLMRLAEADQWDKLHVVHCGVDPEEFSYVDRRARAGRPLTVLSVGRLVADKAHAVLLEAVALLAAEGDDVRLVVAGDGPERAALESLRRELRLGDRVELVGPVGSDRLASLYEAADVFCLPSLAEGLPVVLMEAMARGLPVVTTPVAGIPELVSHERSGLLVAPGRPDAVAAALRRLGRDPELRHRLGEEGRRAVEGGFDARASARRLREILAGGASPASASEPHVVAVAAP